MKNILLSFVKELEICIEKMQDLLYKMNLDNRDKKILCIIGKRIDNWEEYEHNNTKETK